MSKVLIVGGAGFIGTAVARELAESGYDVRVLDNLDPQVHAGGASPPVLEIAEMRRGDVCDPEAVASSLVGVDAVVHLAAAVGVGQSMYQIERYCRVNDLGTAVLLQALLDRPVQKMLVASSMSIYGEGLYRANDGRTYEGAERSGEQLDRGAWELADPSGGTLQPLPTPEWKRPSLHSVYAVNKYTQERLTLTTCGAYGIPAAALRLFNVYGAGQALSNPYTGVLAIFASRFAGRSQPLVFEDGDQRRDFVHVEDVARAFRLALESNRAAGQVINVGSGQSISISEVAAKLAEAMGCPEIVPVILGRARKGDIRHCFADISKARDLLGFEPRHEFIPSLPKFVDWVASQRIDDKVESARQELEARGLVA